MDVDFTPFARRRSRPMRAIPLAALLGALSAGCPSYTFEIKPATGTAEARIVIPAAKPTPADILFVIDDSCSMADKQDNVKRNLGAFISEIAGKGDYHIAVVSNDVHSAAGE